jgi:two-component system chemotaxis response regulator CheY
MRKIVERALRQAGLDLGEVLEASNGAEARVEIQKGSLDTILSDNNMPVMDGLEFLKSLSRIEAAKGVPVIMITHRRQRGPRRRRAFCRRQGLSSQTLYPRTG